jgi:hypothetical protein
LPAVQPPETELPVLTPLELELLMWVAARPRTYGETMEAWRTSCPRSPVWEDATVAGLIEVVGVESAGLHDQAVRLTARGEAALARHRGRL